MSAPMREVTRSSVVSRDGLGEPLQALFSVGTLSGLADGQLLERFTEGRGDAAEAAFAALVERHSAMVLSVCQSVLRDRHDAEDAFQATFLVLALRAGSIRRRDAVGSWLFSAARRVSLQARRQVARHRERERRRAAQARLDEAVSAPPSNPWPELYEELDRLAEPFRAAVVLCDLEGHSYEQAAGMLHCPVGTVQSRLARGRERLRKRLESRGLTSGVVLVGTGALLTARSAAAAVSSRLAMEIGKTAVDIAGGQSIARVLPKTVAGLVGNEIRRSLLTRALTVLSTLVIAGVVAAAGIALVIAGQRDVPNPNAIAVIGKADAGAIHVQVVDAKGKGAPDVLVEVLGYELDHTRSFQTDTEGHVQIPRDATSDGATLLARREDQSFAWTMVGESVLDEAASTKAHPIVMKLLARTHRVTGSVVDREGKPVPGAEIVVTSLGHPINRSVVLPLARSLATHFPRVLADQAGRFALILPEDTDVGLSVEHSRYLGRGGAKAGAAILEPIVLEPAGGISGTVTDTTTGLPVAGVIVGAQLIEYRKRILGGWGEGMTDDQGRFIIVGLEPGVYNVLFETARGRARATARANEGLRVTAGALTPANLTVVEGRPVRGIVIDQETNRPVGGALVGCYGPARPDSGAAVQSRTTDEQGRFTFHVPPGEQRVYIMDGSFSSLSKRTVVVPDQGEIEPVRLLRTNPSAGPMRGVTKVTIRQNPREEKFRPGQRDPANVEQNANPAAPDANLRTVTGRVRDSQGRPLFGVSVMLLETVRLKPGMMLADPLSERFDIAMTDREGTFILQGLPQGELQFYLSRANSGFQTKVLPANRDAVEWTYRLVPESQTKRQSATREDEPIAPALRKRLTFVDLAAHGNDSLADGPGGSLNDLNLLPRGVQKMGDYYFRIGEMMAHVQSTRRPEMPRAVKGIKVHAHGNRLRILHATQWVVEPGTMIGAYLIHYNDGSDERIPIVYGRNLVNWWSFPSVKDEPTEARVAWTGSNESTGPDRSIKIRLFATAWTNPHPEREVATLDMLSAGTDCDPFLVAVTLERDR